MTMSERSRVLVFITLIISLFLSNCSFVRIQNVSAGTATVSVKVPDSGKAYVRNVPSGGIVDVFSSHGGGYTITMIAGEKYLALLHRLRSQIETKLFAESQTLTAEEVALLVENLNNIDRLLEQTREPGATCSGYVPDYETAVAIISYDDINATWVLNCGSGSN